MENLNEKNLRVEQLFNLIENECNKKDEKFDKELKRIHSVIGKQSKTMEIVNTVLDCNLYYEVSKKMVEWRFCDFLNKEIILPESYWWAEEEEEEEEAEKVQESYKDEIKRSVNDFFDYLKTIKTTILPNFSAKIKSINYIGYSEDLKTRLQGAISINQNLSIINTFINEIDFLLKYGNGEKKYYRNTDALISLYYDYETSKTQSVRPNDLYRAVHTMYDELDYSENLYYVDKDTDFEYKKTKGKRKLKGVLIGLLFFGVGAVIGYKIGKNMKKYYQVYKNKENDNINKFLNEKKEYFLKHGLEYNPANLQDFNKRCLSIRGYLEEIYKIFLSELKENLELPVKIATDSYALNTILNYLIDGRADNLKEAINLYVAESTQEKHNRAVLEYEHIRSEQALAQTKYAEVQAQASIIQAEEELRQSQYLEGFYKNSVATASAMQASANAALEINKEISKVNESIKEIEYSTKRTREIEEENWRKNH